MSAATDARDNETERQTRTERELAALEASEQGGTPKPAAAAAAPKPAEKTGVGKDNTRANQAAQIKALKAKLKAALEANNMEFAARMEARLAEIRKATQ